MEDHDMDDHESGSPSKNKLPSAQPPLEQHHLPRGAARRQKLRTVALISVLTAIVSAYLVAKQQIDAGGSLDIEPMIQQPLPEVIQQQSIEWKEDCACNCIEEQAALPGTTTKTDKSFSFQPLEHQKLAIFYHIDLSSSSTTKSKRNISQQLEQISSSAATANGKVSLYYSTAGNITIDIQALCNQEKKLECIALDASAASATKTKDSNPQFHTLTNLYDFCHQRTDYRVIYLNADASSDDALRPALTAAVTSEHCFNNNANNTCNMCGLQMLPFPALHMSSNAFNAQCAYIRNLLPPRDYEQRLDKVASQAFMMRVNCIFGSSLLMHEGPFVYGLNGFAADHWAYSHPSMRPCDLSPEMDILPSEADYQWSMFPRHAFQSTNWPHIHADIWQNHAFLDGFRLKEWLFLPGNIFKWLELYNQVPRNDSFVWSFFPDGDLWRDKVKELGHGALWNVTKPFAEPGTFC